MSSAYLHPEFGYFCPSPGLRRAVRVALAFTVIGALAGAGGVAALIADHDLDGVALTVRADREPGAAQSSVVTASVVKAPVVKAPVVKAEASQIASAEQDTFKSAGKSDAFKSAAKPDSVKPESSTVASKVDAAKTDAAKTDGAIKTDLAATSCEGNTWAYLDGKCGSGQVRKMRIVRAAPAISRTSPAAAGVVATVAPVAGATAGRKGATSNSSQANSAQAPLSVAMAARTPEPSQQAVAAARKPQKTASSQSRRRDLAASNAPVVRPQPTGPLAFGQGGFFGLFR
jgi:hypothetical protein